MSNKNKLTNLQNLILTIWESQLDITKIELDDDFFDLGGHSLKLINVLDLFHTNEHYPVLKKLKIMDLFEHTTIETLSDYLLTLETK